MSTRLLICALAVVAQCSSAAAAERQPREERAIGLPASYQDHPLYNIYAERVSMFATLPRLDGGIAFVGDSLTDEGLSGGAGGPVAARQDLPADRHERPGPQHSDSGHCG
jgi:hypothetical protein